MKNQTAEAKSFSVLGWLEALSMHAILIGLMVMSFFDRDDALCVEEGSIHVTEP
jgi:hypothetical protein